MVRSSTVSTAETSPQSAQQSPSRAAIRRPRILIAEDESPMREFIDRVLRHAGYTTARFVDGQEALAFAEQAGPFDLLLTDVVMPRMGGMELANRLRKVVPDLKVLYFTGYPDRLFQEKRTLWADEAVLEKPSSVDRLLHAVSLLLDRQARQTNVTDVLSARH